MAINNIGQMNQALKSYSSNEWTQKAKLNDIELGQINLDGFEQFKSEQADGKSFGQFLTESIGKVNNLQQEANVAIEKLASGESKNIQETLLTVEKAEIAFKMMNQIRSKIIDAYREIMKMQV